MKTIILMGYAVTEKPDDVIKDLDFDSNIAAPSPTTFACLNPHSFVESQRNLNFQKALWNASILSADGVGITIAARLKRVKAPRRYTGSDCFYDVHSLVPKNKSLRVFLLGSTETVLEKVKDRLQREHPHIEISGMISPPFLEDIEQWDDREAINQINASDTDVLWVSMTAPKQELWINRSKADLDVKFIGAVGAVFDFYAGTKKRSGKLLRWIGLEWLGRLVQEPQRLWRRTFKSGIQFFYAILCTPNAPISADESDEGERR